MELAHLLFDGFSYSATQGNASAFVPRSELPTTRELARLRSNEILGRYDVVTYMSEVLQRELSDEGSGVA